MENISSNRLKRNNLASIIYVCIILGVFPLVFHDYYFDMLTFKYQFYYSITSIYLCFIIVNNIADAFMNKRMKFTYHNIFKKLTMPELSILFFLIIAILSTIQSDFFYESFWGNEGRYTGLFTLILYAIGTLFIIRYLHFKNWILYLFLFSGFLVCCLGITDYYKLDILGFKVNIAPTQYNMFMSTIGNVNTYTSYVALIMAVSAVMFSTEETHWKIILYYFCMVCSFFAIIMGLSDNSYLSLLTLFGFLPLYLFGTKRGLRRYFLIITTLLSVIYMIININKAFPDKVLEMQGIIDHIPLTVLKVLLIFMICITAIAYIVKYWFKSENDNLGMIWRYIWLALLLVIVGVILFTMYDINIALNKDRYGSLTQYLLFNDDWGTHRGFNWRIGMENYNRFSPIHKIFGYGPDTYGIITHFNDYKEMAEKYNETYDSAHNEYLQYFITMGPLSLISYLVFIASSIRALINKSKDNIYAISIMFAVLCYSVQAFVNISVPIVAPIMFVLLASGLAKINWNLSGTSKENHF
ncbi:O-antigen ligase family protein [Lacrimispora amygdalina]|uniref:O-antigen ligase family protein n=1 Tax=Lacrimispora amygdalina TaxID=253257 RepID=UPI000BE2C8FF|nr:O-antigen ligase family protein [Lacrimispora amygdalina]